MVGFGPSGACTHPTKKQQFSNEVWFKNVQPLLLIPGIVTLAHTDEDNLTLDKYTIVESERMRTVYDWLQHFSPEDLEKEFRDTGFSVEGFYSDVSGTAYAENSTEFAVIATRT